MNTISKIWNYQTTLIMALIINTYGCKHEEPEPEQIPTVTTYVSDISDTSALCAGNIVSNSCNGMSRGICWSNINLTPTISGNAINDWPNFSLNNCNIAITLGRLTPGTTYYVRAFVGDGIYGNVIEFTTTGNVVGDIRFNPDLMYDSVTDIVGNTYKTIEIGSQVWMAENLKTSKLNDGTDIPIILNDEEWGNLSTPGYCYYLNNASKYKNAYGALYNWYTVETGKLCPTGWHVPGYEEWTTLTSYLGGGSVASGKLRETGTTHWTTTNTEVTNSSGFTALPGGSHDGEINDQYVDLDLFYELGYAGCFWSSDTMYSWPGVYLGSSYFILHNSCIDGITAKATGHSIRCVKD